MVIIIRFYLINRPLCFSRNLVGDNMKGKSLRSPKQQTFMLE